MIWLTRLNGHEFVLNADLIEQIESIPDTVITMVDGRKHMVTENAYEVVDRVIRFRNSILEAPRLVPAPAPTPSREGSVHRLEPRKKDQN